MAQQLSTMLTNHFQKETVVAYLKESPGRLEIGFQLALSDAQPEAWRATWILGHVISQKDPALTPHTQKITEIILNRPDGHQRELLKLLEKSAIPEELEGKVFDICATIWENQAKIPSVRMIAIRMMWSITQKYPDLQREMEFYSQEQYIKDLSPGIKNSIHRMLKRM